MPTTVWIWSHAALVAAGRLLFAVLALLSGQSAYAETTDVEVKALFILNFTKFTEWPAKPENAPLRLCVPGADPLGPALENAKGKVAKERKIEVAVLDAAADFRGCDVLFIPATMEKHLDRIVALARGAGMLTVGDTEGFAQRGVMLNFFSEGGKLRFEANLDAVRRGGLKLSSRLLSLARIVGPL
jgi:hypothetical protein